MHQIRLDVTAFEGQSNAYLLGTGTHEPTTLIDTGIATPEVEAQLRDGLSQEGVTFEDIDQVLLTHFHYDHVGLAGTIQAAAGAPVYAHASDAKLIGGGGEAVTTLVDGHRERIVEWGLPDAPAAELDGFLRENATLSGDSVSVTELQAGDRIAIGDREIKVHHLPGHTAGHVGYQVGEGDFVSGDTLLPVYTPNIGGADMRVERPLATYLGTLRSFLREEISVVWPGHRERIADPAARAREIRGHHRDRTGRVIDVLAEHGPMNVWEVSAELFGDLAGIHILHGPGEAFAHLDHLVAEGIATREDGEYRLLDASAEADRLIPPL